MGKMLANGFMFIIKKLMSDSFRKESLQSAIYKGIIVATKGVIG